MFDLLVPFEDNLVTIIVLDLYRPLPERSHALAVFLIKVSFYEEAASYLDSGRIDNISVFLRMWKDRFFEYEEDIDFRLIKV